MKRKRSFFLLPIWVGVCFLASCHSLRPHLEPTVVSQNIGDVPLLEVYNGCKLAFQFRGIRILKESKPDFSLVTDWYYFNRPGTNWRFRFRLKVKAVEGETAELPGTRLILKVDYQGGMPISTEPYLSPLYLGPLGYHWKDIPPDKFLRRLLDEIFIDIKTYCHPIVLNPPWREAARAVEATYKLIGLPKEKINQMPFDNRYQFLVGLEAENTAIIKVKVVEFKASQSLCLPLSGRKELAPYLRESFYCDFNHPLIRQKARELKGDETNAWLIAQHITSWVAENIYPLRGGPILPASEVLKRNQGDCRQRTVLIAALARSLGIPTRGVLGLVEVEGNLDYHLWPEFFVGEWVGLDPYRLIPGPMNNYLLDPSHIKLAYLRLDRETIKDIVYALGDIFGRLKIEVLDFKLRELEKK